MECGLSRALLSSVKQPAYLVGTDLFPVMSLTEFVTAANFQWYKDLCANVFCLKTLMFYHDVLKKRLLFDF